MQPLNRRAIQLLIVGLLVALGVTAAAVSAEPPTGTTVASPSAASQGITVPLVANHHVVAPPVQSRFGVGTDKAYGIDSFSVARLGASWYLDWAARPDAPTEPGVAYYPTIRLSPVMEGNRRTGNYTFSPNESTLAATAAAFPGAVWLVGNEPDCDRQDNLTPAEYARAYGEMYALIKGLDPTALVAAGQIVQPTLLRLRYLDLVLEEYQRLYGTDMPVDVWAIHAYPLREAPPDDPYQWGAGIPPGVAPSDEYPPLLLELDQTADIGLFREFVRDFRSWMTGRGYRHRPLIITEFGVLMPYDYAGADLQSVLLYMQQAFDFLREARDPATGLPYDDHRLVQQWAWFKLVRPADAVWPSVDMLAGDLYDGATSARLPAGDHYAAYTAGLPRQVNLRAVDLTAEVQVGSRDAQLTARVVNNGTIRTARPVRVRFYLGSPSEGRQIGTDQFVPPLGGHAIPRTVSVTWKDAPPGEHTVNMVVDPLNEIAETDDSDNGASAAVRVD